MQKGNAYRVEDLVRNSNANTEKVGESVAVGKNIGECSAEELVVNTIPSVGDDIEALFAVIEEMVKRNDKSTEALIKAGAEKFGSTKYYKVIGNYYMTAGLIEKGKEAYKKAIEISDSLIDVEKSLYNLTDHYFFTENDFATGEIYAQKLMKMSPTSGLAYRLFAEIKNHNGEYHEALQLFDKAIAAGEEKPELLLIKGLIMCESMEKPEEALGLYSKATKLKPDVNGLNYYTGIAYLRLDKFKEAVPYFNKALLIESAPKKEVIFFRAVCYRLLERYSDAIADYTQVLQMDPSHGEAHYQKGLCLTELSQFEDACSEFDQAIENGVSNPELYNVKGRCLQALKKNSEAIKQFERALAEDPDSVDALFQLAYEYDKKRKYQTTILHYKKLLTLVPDDKDALNNLGYAYQKMKDYPTALNYYNQVLKVDPTYSLALRNREKLLKSMNQSTTANIQEEPPKEEPASAENKAGLFQKLYKVFS